MSLRSEDAYQRHDPPARKPQQLIHDLVDRNLGSTPRATAVEYGRHRFTWRELDTRIHHVASGLRAARVQPGDSFAVLAHNHPACLETLFAAALTGTTAVIVNWRLPEPEVIGLLQEHQVKMLFIGIEFADLLERIRPELDDLNTWVVVGSANPQSHGSDAYEMWLEMHETGESMYDSAQHHPDADDLVLHAHMADERDNVALSHRHIFQGVHALPDGSGADSLLEEPLYLVREMIAALHGMWHGSRTVLMSQSH